MLKDKDLWVVAVLWWLYSRQGGARPGAPGPTEPTQRLPTDIGEGWWFWWFPTAQNDQYQAALAKELRRAKRRNGGKRRWEVRKTIGGTALGATVVVFFVFEPFRWELPGLPMPAPRGIDTDLTDVAEAIPEPPTLLRQLAQVLVHEAWEYLRDIALGRRTNQPQPF